MFLCTFQTPGSHNKLLYLAAMGAPVFAYDRLYQFTIAVFIHLGCTEQDAKLATEVLLLADLRGVDSHGIARLSGYIRLCEGERIKAKAEITILHETLSTATVDGDAGFGLVIAPKAMQIAIDKAKVAGTGWVSVQNSNHFGIAGYHAMMALPHDMIGICMTNASPIVAPTFSRERLLGTNPICVAVPAGRYPPFVADLATTTAANGKLEMLQRKGEETPGGWLQDSEGNPTVDAHALKTGGALLPLGGDREHGSHKGYALGAIVDIFSGVLSGANYGPWVPPFPAYIPMPQNMPGKGLGHFFGAMRIDAFRPAEEFRQHMDTWLERFRSAKTIEGYDKVLVPGDPEREIEIQRRREGIPMLDVVIKDLQAIAAKFSLPF